MSALGSGKESRGGAADEETLPGASNRRRTHYEDDSGSWGHRQDYTMGPLSHGSYNVGWICALPIEMAAATAMLDSVHGSLPSCSNDSNTYTLGNISIHNIVIACLPSGHYGINNAATVANNMHRSFPSICIRLMVGIGGGVPSRIDIRLGDVVVAHEVIQHDFGKIVQDACLERTSNMKTPPQGIMTAVSKLRADHEKAHSRIPSILQKMMERNPYMAKYTHPGPEQDQLFQATYVHVQPLSNCDQCDPSKLVSRPDRDSTDPKIYYGVIASGNQVMKDANTRDILAQELDVLCFEMEAAGLMDSFPCLVVRGICDYSDSHKTKRWQEYAAAVAAAYAKELLSFIPNIDALAIGVDGIPKRRLDDPSFLVADGRLKRPRYEDPVSTPLSNEHKDCLRSLSFPGQESRHLGIPSSKGTCEWLLEDAQYQAWMDKPRGLFWIKGNPGSGKSFLMKFAVTKMHLRKPRELVTSFFIHGRGTLLQKTPLGLFRALLNSMLKLFPEYLSRLTERFEDQERRLGSYQDGRWEWDENELREFMTEMLTKGTKNQPVVIFVDALDECGEVHAKMLLAYFRDLMEEVMREEGQVKICFSSRHYPILGHNTIPTISVETRNGEDIRFVIQESLKDIDLESTRQQIWEKILSKAQGGFQWAVLVTAGVVDQYTKGIRVGKLHENLTTTPETLDELYSHILGDITLAEKHHMTKLFQWVLYAERPLSSQELREALATDKDMGYSTISQFRSHDCWINGLDRFETYVKHISRGLVEFQTRELWEQYEPEGENWDREAQFIHQSVADYVVKKFLNHTGHDRYAAQSQIGAGHFEISRSCLRYMMLREVLEGAGLTRGQLSTKFPLVPYAVRFLFYHIHRVEQEGIHQPDLLSLIQWDRQFTPWKVAGLWKIMDPDSAHTPIGWPFIGATPLHILVAFGSRSACNILLQKDDAEVDGRDSEGNTPLLLAIRESHHDIALTLLDRSIEWQRRHESSVDQSITRSGNGQRPGPFVNVNAENNDGDTPLNMALAEKNSEVIFKLMDAGADPKFFGQETALVFHAIFTKDRKLLMKLIEKKVKLDGAVYFALQELSSMDDGDILEEFLSGLLKAGANTSKTKETYTDSEDSENMYEGEDVYGDELDDNAILLASRRGQAAAVNLLMLHGVSATSQNEQGRFPLLVAAESGHQDIVEILLQSAPPTAVDMVDINGQTPLSVAAETGHDAVVRLLLEKGANPETINNESQTPLILAVQNGHEAIVRLLLEKGTNPETINNESQTPLILAIQNGHEAIVRLLLEKGAASLETMDNSSRTPLSWAMYNKHEAIVRLLLEKGASLKTMDNESQTPFSWAIQNGHEAIVRLLLEKGAANLETMDNSSRTPLSWATYNGHDAVVRLLLEKGANPETQGFGQTPLSWAAERGYEAIVRLLLEKGANPETVDNFGQTPLLWAIHNEHEAIVRLLLEKGVSPETQGSGQTPLFQAISKGNEAIIRLLLEKGANLETKDAFGQTPLSLAIHNRNEAIVQLLLEKGANRGITRHFSYTSLTEAVWTEYCWKYGLYGV